MEKIASLILLLLITLSSFLSLALCRPINDPASAAEKSAHLDISPAPAAAAAGDVSAGIEQSSPRWWFRGGFIPRLPWPLVRPPFRPWRHWEFVSPPRIAGGFKWPRWRFVIPARTWPHWRFVHQTPPPAIDGGSHWPPTTDSTHWQFVQPPMPSGDYTIPAPPDTTTPPPGAV